MITWKQQLKYLGVDMLHTRNSEESLRLKEGLRDKKTDQRPFLRDEPKKVKTLRKRQLLIAPMAAVACY